MGGFDVQYSFAEAGAEILLSSDIAVNAAYTSIEALVESSGATGL